MAASNKNRLLKEMSTILKSPPEGITVAVDEKDIYWWQADIVEPQGSPYGTLHIKILIPNEYPFKAPEFYVTPIFKHENLSPEDGLICPKALFENWAPSIKMRKALERVRELFSVPPPETHE